MQAVPSFVEVKVFALGFFGQAASVGFIHIVEHFVGVSQKLFGVVGAELAEFADHTHRRNDLSEVVERRHRQSAFARSKVHCGPINCFPYSFMP
jgi:hypothetical protein